MSLLHDFAIHVVHLRRLTWCTDLSSLFREDQVIFCKSRGVDIFKSSYIMFSPPCLLSIVCCSIFFEFAVELFSIFPVLLLALYIDRPSPGSAYSVYLVYILKIRKPTCVPWTCVNHSLDHIHLLT